MNEKPPEHRPPKVHEDGDTSFDAFENRDLDAIDAECRGLDLVQALAHFWIDDETGERTFALSKSGIEEAGRLGGGVNCPIEGLRVTQSEGYWHAEQEGESLTTRLRRVGSASSSLLNKWGKVDRFGRRKAVSLAMRNAIKALLTPEQTAGMITRAMEIGSTEQIEPPWKGKGDDDGRKKGDRPPPKKARRGSPPTKDESLDYFNGIVADLVNAIPNLTDRDHDEVKRDMVRAIVRRGTQGAFHTAVEMPNERLIGLIRRLERAEKKDGEISVWLRGDDWEDVLEHGSGRAELTKPTPAAQEGEENSGATPSPPLEDDDTRPGDVQQLPAGEAEKDAPNSGSPSGGDASGLGGELTEDASSATFNAGPSASDDDDDPGPDEPEGGDGGEPDPSADSSPAPDSHEEETPPEEDEPEDLDAAREEAAEVVGRILEAVAIEGIGKTAKERERAVARVQTAMIKAIVRTGTGGRTEYVEHLTVEDLRRLTKLVEHDERAIVLWLTSGRYLTSEVVRPATQRELLTRPATNTDVLQEQ